MMKNSKKYLNKSLPHIVAVVIFICLSAAFLSPQLNGYLLKQHDIKQHIGMSKEIVDFREKFDKEPLWTNTSFAGMPTYQISLKNPNSVNKIQQLVLRILPRPIGYLVVLLVGFYILLLCFDVRRWLAIVGAIAFGFASFNFLYMAAGHNARVYALAFIPPLIGCLIYGYRKNNILGSAFLSLFVCWHRFLIVVSDLVVFCAYFDY